MTTLENIKNRLIDKILAARNEQFLEAIEKIFVPTQDEKTIPLSTEQIEMLIMSDLDIEKGSLISEPELDKLDKQWLG